MRFCFPFCKFHSVVLLLFLLIPFQQNSFSQGLLNPTTHPKFVNPLPIPAQLNATNGGKFNMHMAQTQQWLGLVDGTGTPLMTTVWGYGLKKNAVTYPGPTFVASKNVPVYVTWFNDLPGHFLPVDPSLHMAHPENLMSPEEVAAWYAAGNVPTVAHLHGGHTESASDGLPEAWFTQNSKVVGRYFLKTNYVYDNSQEAATLWYHDHALGITRLNVYAGLAGFYLLDDNNESMLRTTGVLPAQKHTIEIVIQDKSFYNNGQLFWPANPNEPSVFFDRGGIEPDEWNAWQDFIVGEGVDTNQTFNLVFPNGGPTALAEFFGDFIVVNGMLWPYLDVEPRPYRFRLLNGSDSRFYILKLDDGSDFLQIGTDDGLLPSPVSINELIIAPGERADIVVDFSKEVWAGKSIKLLNIGPDEPYGGGTPGVDFDSADPLTTGQIMQFNVVKPLKVNRGLPVATVNESSELRPTIVPLVSTTTTPRRLGLFEGNDEYGRLQPMLGAFIPSSNSIESLTWDDAITENPALNAVEEWEVYNFTGDAHPVHLHLVAFQIINRQPISFDISEKDQVQHNDSIGVGGIVSLLDITTTGPAEDPALNEMGWKDTFIVPPGYVGRVIAKFDKPGRYVWHCHILSHEDHEMMRPYHVGAMPKLAPENEIASVKDFRLSQNYPNPFNPSTVINFSIPTENTVVSLKIYNSIGQEVGTLINQIVPAGNHEVRFDATGLSSGVYFYTLTAGNFVESKKMIVLK